MSDAHGKNPNWSEYWHFSRLPGSLTRDTACRHHGELGYVSVEDTARLMQGFVPALSFTKDCRVIAAGRLSQPRRRGRRPRRLMANENHAAAQGAQAARCGAERGGVEDFS
jgi:hypothetical protein